MDRDASDDNGGAGVDRRTGGRVCLADSIKPSRRLELSKRQSRGRAWSAALLPLTLSKWP